MKANALVQRLVALTAVAALAACAPSRPAPAPAPQPTFAPRPVPPPTPRTIAGWRDMPITPGAWSWAMAGTRSVASFSGPGAVPLLVLACDRAAQRVTLSRTVAASAASSLTVATTEMSRTLSAVPSEGALVVSLTPRDPLLDGVAFSRGRFAVETAGQAALYLPSSAELSRVIEDCR